MSDTNQPVDPNGVPQDNSTFAQDDDTPLNAATNAGSAPSGIAGARANADDRYGSQNTRLTKLQKQADDLEGRESDAYGQQKKVLEDATSRLLGLSVGPSELEGQYRLAAAYGSAAPGGRGINISGVNATHADILKEQREAELARQEMVLKYQSAVPAAIIGQVGAQMNQNIGQQRVASSQTNNAGNEQFKNYAQTPAGVKVAADGSWSLIPGAKATMEQINAAKLAGKVLLIPQPDGSKRAANASDVAAFKPTGAAASESPATGAPPIAGASPGASAPSTSPASSHSYEDMFTPSSVLDPKYSAASGALTDQNKSAYVKTAQDAFAPKYFNESYLFQPKHFGDPAIYKAETTAMQKDLQVKSDASDQMLYNYGHVLSAMDSAGGDQNLRTGPVGQKITAFSNYIRGFNPALAESLTRDPELQKLGTAQEVDKYARAAALTGLKAIFAGRITNQEMQQRMLTLPSTNLLPAVTRMLAMAQAEQAQDVINRNKVFGQYTRNYGDPNVFDAFYDANFSSFKNSRLKGNLQAANQSQPTQQAANSATQNPLVQYYVALGQWKAAGSKGSPPAKPQ